MKSQLKKTFLIAMICMHNHSAYTSQEPENPLNIIATLAYAVAATSIIKIGTIYFEKFLHTRCGIQTTPDMPKIKMNVTMSHTLSTGENYNPLIKDNRDADLKNKEAKPKALKCICPNGKIVSPWTYDFYKRKSDDYKNRSSIMNWLLKTTDKNLIELKEACIQSQQSRRLNENGKNELPVIPKAFNGPEYNKCIRPVVDIDLVNYLNYDIKD